MTTYAKPVNKMNAHQKMWAEIEAQNFAKEVNKKFVNIEKFPGIAWSATLSCDDGSDVGASIVRCPHCEEIQVCWGEYGDPAIEICICTQCGENYEVEPF